MLPLSYLRGATLDFVDTPLADVVRAMSRAYDTPMLVDDSLNIRVTFHLDGVGVMEGLTALCSAHGLEVVQEGSVFHVRRARARGESEFRMQDSLVTLSVKGESVLVRGNSQILEEMIYNLADNGIKYNNPGGYVDLITFADADGKTVGITCKDNGIGIPEDQKPRVFERFFRVDKSRSKAIGGTGLGLSIVKHGALSHGAEILLESKEGEGTSITLRFPRTKEE